MSVQLCSADLVDAISPDCPDVNISHLGLTPLYFDNFAARDGDSGHPAYRFQAGFLHFRRPVALEKGRQHTNRRPSAPSFLPDLPFLG